MKRLIRYHNTIGNKNEFSDCSSRYEVLPYLVHDEDGFDKLTEIAKELQLTIDKDSFLHGDKITHSVELVKNIPGKADNKYTEYLGFYPIKNLVSKNFPAVEKANKKLTKEQCREIVGNQLFGVEDVAVNVDGGNTLIKSGWNFYHDLKLLGYDLNSFVKLMKITDEGFYDDTFTCSECNKADSMSNGYEYNYQIVECNFVGKNCGCLDDYFSKEESLDDRINKADPIPLTTAEEWEKKGKIQLIESFIGGMVDKGRGGWINGKRVRNGQPKIILKKLLEKYPKDKFIFSLDDSGQFQHYFSVWLKGSKNKASKIKEILKDITLE